MLNHYDVTRLERLIRTFHVCQKAINKSWKTKPKIKKTMNAHLIDRVTRYELKFTARETLITTLLMSGLHDDKHNKHMKPSHDRRISVNAKSTGVNSVLLKNEAHFLLGPRTAFGFQIWI